MPAVLIAGCGYVGAAAADLFHQRGWTVEGWTFSGDSARELSAKPYAVRAVNIAHHGEVIAAAKEFDAVIHCASSRGGDVDTYRRVYRDGASNLAATFPCALLCFTSSTSVYGQTGGDWVTELSAAEPHRETGRILREAEEIVLDTGGVVARVAGIYGPGRSALLSKLLTGTAVLEPNERFLNQVHREDVAEALFFLVQHHTRTAAGKRVVERLIYNVSDDHPFTQRECYEWLAATLQRPVPPSVRNSVERKRGNSNKRVSSEKLQRLGWSPRYPTFQRAMTESILPALQRSGPQNIAV